MIKSKTDRTLLGRALAAQDVVGGRFALAKPPARGDRGGAHSAGADAAHFIAVGEGPGARSTAVGHRHQQASGIGRCRWWARFWLFE